MEPAFGVAVTCEQQTLTIAIRGELDVATGPVLRDHLAQLVDHHFAQVVVDLADMGFVDCTGTRAITESLQDLPGDCVVTLRSPNASVSRVLRFVGLDARFVIDDAPGLLAPGNGSP